MSYGDSSSRSKLQKSLRNDFQDVHPASVLRDESDALQGCCLGSCIGFRVSCAGLLFCGASGCS